MKTLIFNTDDIFQMAVSSIPSDDYLDESNFKIALIPEGESYDKNYAYSPVDGVAVKGDLIPVDTEEINKITAEWNAKAYSRSREKEYPSIGDQLDDIYHNGIDSWKATIKKTKDKYPKP